MSKKRQLTPLQEQFLFHLFGEAQGDPKLAAEMAGYKGNNWQPVVNALADEITERAKKLLAVHGPQAVFATLGVMVDPLTPGAKEKLSAAEKIMDRAGLGKREALDVDAGNAISIFALPEKRSVNPEDVPDED